MSFTSLSHPPPALLLAGWLRDPNLCAQHSVVLLFHKQGKWECIAVLLLGVYNVIGEFRGSYTHSKNKFCRRPGGNLCCCCYPLMSRYCLEKTNKKKTLTAIDDFFFFFERFGAEDEFQRKWFRKNRVSLARNLFSFFLFTHLPLCCEVEWRCLYPVVHWNLRPLVWIVCLYLVPRNLPKSPFIIWKGGW